MSYEDCLKRASMELESARNIIRDEIRNYPTPVSGCDAQYNHLIGTRNAISAALETIKTPAFVATPRTLEPGAGVESR
ncbi:MAG: hypothetical protein AAFQ81_16525 [Pseudomonadota bacterium]